MFVLVEVQVSSANALVAEQTVGRGELGHDQAASPELLDEAAKHGVRDAGHGRQDCGGTNFDCPDVESGRECSTDGTSGWQRDPLRRSVSNAGGGPAG